MIGLLRGGDARGGGVSSSLHSCDVVDVLQHAEGVTGLG